MSLLFVENIITKTLFYFVYIELIFKSNWKSTKNNIVIKHQSQKITALTCILINNYLLLLGRWRTSGTAKKGWIRTEQIITVNYRFPRCTAQQINIWYKQKANAGSSKGKQGVSPISWGKHGEKINITMTRTLQTHSITL